jgi:hypothetical protein
MSVRSLVPAWWTWRLSAHSRVASLLFLWLLLLAAPVLGTLTWPLLALRLSLSSGQMVFNMGLGRIEPLEPRTRTDWLLLGVTLLFSYVAAEIGKVTGDQRSPLLVSCVALPYSAIQVRACLRSYRAGGELAEMREPLALPVGQQRAA